MRGILGHRRRSVGALVLWAAIGCEVAGSELRGQAGSEEGRLDAELREVLGSSTDRGELRNAAVAMAQSEQPGDLQALTEFLASPAFLDRLDSEEDYDQESRQLRLARVVKALVDNETPAARHALLGLTTSPSFLDDPARVDLLIDAWAEVPSPPPEAVEFWDAHSQPDDGFVNRTMNRLAYNGSRQAIGLIEKKLAEVAHPVETRVYWAHRFVIELRNEPAMLDGCRRLLSGPLEPAVKIAVVEALFDHRPEDWYASHDEAKVPSRAAASEEALEKLREVGRYALANLELGEDLRQRVEAEIGAAGGPSA